MTNIGQFYIDFAIKSVGRTSGGPAKAAVVASGLFGSVTGSAVANVAGTGPITIPLMYQVALGALIPALIFYGAVFAMVHFTAKAEGLTGTDTSSLPNISHMLRTKGLLLLPLIVLIYFLVIVKISVIKAAVYSVLITMLIGILILVIFLQKRKKTTLNTDILDNHQQIS